MRGLLVALLSIAAEATRSATAPIVNIGGNRQLLLGDDDILLAERSNNTRVAVNRAADPVTWQTVLESDQRWERGCSVGIGSVLRDDHSRNHSFIRMWYTISGCPHINYTLYGDEGHHVVAVAESEDGVRFHKPDLGLQIQFGTESLRHTNLVGFARTTAPPVGEAKYLPCTFCQTVFVDPHSIDGAYRACSKIHSSELYGERWGPLACAESPDGFLWRYSTTLRIGDCDSQGNFLWDSVHKQWLLFHRLWVRHGTPAHPVGDPRNFRCVRRLVGAFDNTSWPAQASDWLPQNATYTGSWAEGEGSGKCLSGYCGQATVMCPDHEDYAGGFGSSEVANPHHQPPHDFYGATVWSDPGNPGVLLALPMRFWHYQPHATLNNTVPSGMDISCTVQSNQASGGCTAEGTCTGSCDPASKESGLMYSRDGGASFAYVGNDRAASVLGVGLWGSGASATTWVVPTPIELSDRLLIYISGTDVNENMRLDPENSTPKSFAGVAIARLGGLASLDAIGYGDAAFAFTHPLVFNTTTASGLHLFVNFDTRGIGALSVELQDPSTGSAIPGFDLASARSFAGGNTLRGVATWRHGSDVSVLAGTPFVIKFAFIAPCKLFSFEVAANN